MNTLHQQGFANHRLKQLSYNVPLSSQLVGTLRRLERVFLVAIVFVKRRKILKKDNSQCRQTINIFATLLLGNTLKALMTSYRLPRQHARSTIIGKTKSVTYRFYFFLGKLPKFFNLLESSTKSYLVEFKIHRKMAYYSLQKIVLDRFPQVLFPFRAILRRIFTSGVLHALLLIEI